LVIVFLFDYLIGHKRIPSLEAMESMTTPFEPVIPSRRIYFGIPPTKARLSFQSVILTRKSKFYGFSLHGTLNKFRLTGLRAKEIASVILNLLVLNLFQDFRILPTKASSA
jgi:hypothetical protein